MLALQQSNVFHVASLLACRAAFKEGSINRHFWAVKS